MTAFQAYNIVRYDIAANQAIETDHRKRALPARSAAHGRRDFPKADAGERGFCVSRPTACTAMRRKRRALKPVVRPSSSGGGTLSP